jgi:hypothetical protein
MVIATGTPSKFTCWLERIGLVTVIYKSMPEYYPFCRPVGTYIIAPFHWPIKWKGEGWIEYFTRLPKMHGWFYLFRNRPGVIKWLPGRMLPRRWGFGILGFEFGDRG